MTVLNKILLCFMLFIVYGCDNSNDDKVIKQEIKQEIETKKDKKIIKVATLNWSPYVGEKLEYYGIFSKKTKEVFTKMGYEQDITFMSWKRVLFEVEQGNYDVAFPAYYSAERAKKYIISDKVMNTPLVFLKNKNSKIQYKTLEDLKSYKIGIVRGYINTKEFDNSNYLNKIVGSSDLQNLRLLAKNRLDLVVIDKIVAQGLIQKHKEFENKFNFIKKALDDKPLYLLFSRKNKQSLFYAKEFNKILKEINNGK